MLKNCQTPGSDPSNARILSNSRQAGWVDRFFLPLSVQSGHHVRTPDDTKRTIHGKMEDPNDDRRDDSKAASRLN